MPLSPHTPPGTHVVVTWVADTLDEYAYEVILPSYRRKFLFICQALRFHRPSFVLGQRYVLDSIEPAVGTKSGFMCTLRDRDDYGHALEHFDVASLPKSITNLLVSKPVDEVV